MDWLTPIRELWPLLVVLAGYFLHNERRLSRMETDLRWLKANHMTETATQGKE